MVYFKISDGEVTRKFKVNPGEITFEQLKERIGTLFPKAVEGTQDLHLKYRDSDGDLISISTNEEFQEALAELPQDHIWKLHIHGTGARPHPEGRHVHAARSGVPHDFFFQPTHPSPFGLSYLGGMSDPWFGWGDFPMRRRPSFPWHSSPFSNLEHEFDKMLGHHTDSLNAMHNTGGEKSSEESAKAEPEGAMQPQSDGGAVADTSDGKMQIKNFGSWEPKEFDGPFGKGRIIGPVGYYVSWSSGPEEGEKTETPEEKKTEEAPAAAAAKEATEGMET